MRLFGKEQQSEQGRRDESLRKKMESHELTPPSYLWDAIEEKLPETKRRRPGALLYYVLPVAACLVAAIVLFIISGDKTSPGMEQIAEKPVPSKQRNPYLENRSPEQAAANAEAPVIAKISANDEADEPVKSFVLSERNPNNPENESKDNLASDQPEGKIEPENPIVKDPPVDDSKIPFTRNEENKQREKDNLAILNDTATGTEKKPEKEEAPEIAPLVNKKPKSAAGRWMAGLRFSPGYSYRFATAFIKEDLGPPASMSSGNENLANHETSGSAFGIALLGKYAFSKKLSLITGLEYNRSSINSHVRVNYYEYYDSISLRVVTGEFVETSLLGNIQDKNADENYEFEPFPGVTQTSVRREKIMPARYYFHVFEIPVELRADFTGRRIGWFIEGGPRLRMLQSYYVKVYDEQMGTWPKSSLSSIYNTFQAGMHLHTGIQVPFSKFMFEAGPHFNTMLSPLHNRQERTRLFQGGASLTAWYKF